MTVIYAADKDSLALLPELLCAMQISEDALPSEGKYKEFKANTSKPVSNEGDCAIRIAGAAAKTLSLSDYKGQSLTEACAHALAEKGIEAHTATKPAPSDKPKF